MECVPMGSAMRVAAIDPVSGVEINFQAPANAGKEEIRRLAISKLTYVMNKPRKA